MRKTFDALLAAGFKITEANLSGMLQGGAMSAAGPLGAKEIIPSSQQEPRLTLMQRSKAVKARVHFEKTKEEERKC